MHSEDVEPPDKGTRVQYDAESGSFGMADSPIIPYVHGDGVGEIVVSAARRVLDAAADETGREIHWLQVYLGEEAERRYGAVLPEETINVLERFRIGLIGSLSTDSNHRTEARFKHRLEVYADVSPISHLRWTPSAVATREGVDVVCFRDITEDTAAGFEYPDGSRAAGRIRQFLEMELNQTDIESGAAGFGIRPVTRSGTERVVERAIEYALDNDRNRMTVVHRGDQLPATEGGFGKWALTFAEEEYGEATITEEAFRAEYDDYPESELVVAEKHTNDVCRDLLTDPTHLDVLVAPPSAGEYVATVASEAVGGSGVTPSAILGDGYLFAGPLQGSTPESGEENKPNPIAAIQAGCLLVEALGWEDTAGVIRDAIEAALADGLVTPDMARQTARSDAVTTTEFTDRIIEHLRNPRAQDSGGVRTTDAERAEIKRKIVGLYNVVFEDQLRATDIQLNQLRSEDEEADIYLPEVGINFRYWRQWSVERRLEVLLHEFAHVEDYDDDHEPSFYDRLVELTEIAESWQSELNVVFDEPIDFRSVKQHIIDSVHEETIEPGIESVDERKQALRQRFDISSGE